MKGHPVFAIAALGLLLAGCAAPGQPAHFARMGRFMGLVANCGCADISPQRMMADYRQALGTRYGAAEMAAMAAYVEIGATEVWDNRTLVCAEVCGQSCMVQSVAQPLGGGQPGAHACLVSERDLHLTDGAQIGMGGDM